MIEAITPYDLPQPAKGQLLELAARSDLLLLGETHGTQEVPRLVLGLLDDLARLGYGGLGMEVGADGQEVLAALAPGGTGELPPPFTLPEWRDGRRNVQMVSLLQQALSRPQNWRLFCFDDGFLREGETGTDRDRHMAESLLKQWSESCAGRKVIAVCGSYHSRLVAPAEPDSGPWPSLGDNVRQMRPDLAVSSVHIVFHGGRFSNMEEKSFLPGKTPLIGGAEVRPGGWLGHTIELHLPHATPVTFLPDA